MTAIQTAKTDGASYALGFTTLDSERSRVPLDVEGRVPKWLSGSLLRNGPAKFEVGEESYEHWFDGLAMLHRFTFDKGKVVYANRFVRSNAYCEAMREGHIMRSEFMTDPCRSLFGRVMARFQDSVTDNPGVSVSTLAGELVALTESPLPIRFDPETLETLGAIEFDQPVRGQITTAHPHHDGRRGYSYLIDMGRRSAYRFYIDEDGHQQVLAELSVARPSYMHSFGMSERYLVLTEFPLRVNPLRLAFSSQPFIRNYRWRPEYGTCFTVIDKADGTVAAQATGAPCFAFHHVNAHEADGALLVDLIAYPDPSIIESLRLARLRAGNRVEAVGRLTRFRIPLERERNRGPQEATHEVLSEVPIELPRIDYARRAGRPYRFVWGAGQSTEGVFIDSIVKLELPGNGTAGTSARTWHEEGCYPGEPVFVARPGGTEEDDGLLLSVVLDTQAQDSFLLVLDAASLAEVARARAPHHIPFGFHGNHFPDPHHPNDGTVHA